MISAVASRAAEQRAEAEFDRQLQALLERGYPRIAGLDVAEFRKRVEPLGGMLPELAAQSKRADEGIAFALVVNCDLAAVWEAVDLVERHQKTGFPNAADLARFAPIDGVTVPDGLAYLITGVDTGKDLRNVTPDAALATIENRKRWPLTIAEGVALVTHYPKAVAVNAGFSLLASRCEDRRVTALWISKGKPKLGWCFAGVPHTWLGSASCTARVGL